MRNRTPRRAREWGGLQIASLRAIAVRNHHNIESSATSMHTLRACGGEEYNRPMPPASTPPDRPARIVLTRREALRLLELIESPPPRNAKFRQAQARYQRMKRAHEGA